MFKGKEEKKVSRVKQFAAALLISLVFLVWRQWPDGKLHLVFCNVGQGDAVLLSYRTSQILIDGGQDNSVLSCLSRNTPFWDRKIELVVSTHPESDHFRGLIEVLKRYRVEKFAANPFGLEQRPQFRQLINLLSEQKVYTFFPVQGDKIRLGKLQFDILWPSLLKHQELSRLEEISKKTTNGFLLVDEQLLSPNEFSIILHLNFGRFDALLTGDAPSLVSQTLAWRGELPRVEVLKAPHHGSGLDNPNELYQATRPQLVVISVGKNSFGHPSRSLIDDLQRQGIKVKRTDKDGEVEVVSDGRSWWAAD
jgi:competence protein ComEC